MTQEDVFIDVKTPVQMRFWLEKGEVAITRVKEGLLCVYLVDKNLQVIVQPRFGRSTVGTNEYNDWNLGQIMALSNDWAICKGARVETRDPIWTDKAVDFFRKMKDSFFCLFSGDK